MKEFLRLVSLGSITSLNQHSALWLLSIMVAKHDGHSARWSLSMMVAQHDVRSARWLLSMMVAWHDDNTAWDGGENVYNNCGKNGLKMVWRLVVKVDMGER